MELRESESWSLNLPVALGLLDGGLPLLVAASGVRTRSGT